MAIEQVENDFFEFRQIKPTTMGQKRTHAILHQNHDSSDYVVLIMKHSTSSSKTGSVDPVFPPSTEPVAIAKRDHKFQVLDPDTPADNVEDQVLSYLKNGGSALLSPLLAQKVLNSLNKTSRQVGPDVTLTKKETLMITYLKDGYSYNEIAEFQQISINGVRFHVKNIYKKLKIRNRGELLRFLKNH